MAHIKRAIVFDQTNLEAVNPALPPKHIPLDRVIRREDDHCLNFVAERRYRNSVAVSLKLTRRSRNGYQCSVSEGILVHSFAKKFASEYPTRERRRATAERRSRVSPSSRP